MQPPSREKMHGINLWTQLVIFGTCGIAMLIGGFFEYRVDSFEKSTQAVSLTSLLSDHPDGAWKKVYGFQVDFRNRIRALPAKGEVDDLHLLIPLRLLGEEDGDPIRFLYLMTENSRDPIYQLFGDFQEERLNFQDPGEILVELEDLDDLPGNVPNVVRNDERVGKEVVVLTYLRNDQSHEFLLIFGTVLLGVAGIFFLLIKRHRRKLKQVQNEI